MASTMLNVGNAIGIALLIALSESGIENLQRELSVSSIENTLQLAFYLAATGQLAALFSRQFLHETATGLSEETI